MNSQLPPPALDPETVTEFELLQELLLHIRSAIRISAHLAECLTPWSPHPGRRAPIHLPVVEMRRDIYRAFYNALRTVYTELRAPSFWMTARIGGCTVPPVPTLRTCRVCGCSEDDACPSHCSWHSQDLCTVCVALIHIPETTPDPVDNYPDPFRE